MSNQNDIIMYSKSWCGDCHRAKRFFADYGIDYKEVDVEKHPEAIPIIRELNDGKERVPTILFPDGNVLVEPGYPELARQTGVKLEEW